MYILAELLRSILYRSSELQGYITAQSSVSEIRVFSVALLQG